MFQIYVDKAQCRKPLTTLLTIVLTIHFVSLLCFVAKMFFSLEIRKLNEKNLVAFKWVSVNKEMFYSRKISGSIT